jgi:hypothetical protein
MSRDKDWIHGILEVNGPHGIVYPLGEERLHAVNAPGVL